LTRIFATKIDKGIPLTAVGYGNNDALNSNPLADVLRGLNVRDNGSALSINRRREPAKAGGQRTTKNGKASSW